MSAAKDHSNGDNDRSWGLVTYVRLDCCAPGRADCGKTGEPVALLRLKCVDESQQQFMLPLDDVRKLTVRLLCTLRYFDDRLARRILSRRFPNDVWPRKTTGRVSRRTNGANVRPSIAPQTPTTPIRDTDVWALIRMMRSVEDHSAFLKLIGATETPTGSMGSGGDGRVTKPKATHSNKKARKDGGRK
jgi:hypothetical protein